MKEIKEPQRVRLNIKRDPERMLPVIDPQQKGSRKLLGTKETK